MAKKIRYAVVGLGYFAQAAGLPAFDHAKDNSELTAFVSDDPLKHQKLGKKYGVKLHYSYDQYEDCLRSGKVDAVYIALPNSMHKEYTVRAAQQGIHVLCEKPMAVTEAECEEMIRACDDHNVKLMIAYRLHFDEANLKAVEIAQSGRLGEIRYFGSLFSQQVKPGDIRLQRRLGGGTLYDIGIYCLNAARYLYRSEPISVTAFSANNGENRFKEIDEMTSVVLRFPDERLASFTVSFGASDVSTYRIVGTKGSLMMDPAYEYAQGLRYTLTANGKSQTKKFPKRDQVAPEFLYFSNCILKNKNPEPSGMEGLADVRVIRAMYQSAETGRPVALGPFSREERPGLRQTIKRPAVQMPELVHAESPSGS